MTLSTVALSPRPALSFLDEAPVARLDDEESMCKGIISSSIFCARFSFVIWKVIPKESFPKLNEWLCELWEQPIQASMRCRLTRLIRGILTAAERDPSIDEVNDYGIKSRLKSTAMRAKNELIPSSD